jgi:hypothetical protein
MKCRSIQVLAAGLVLALASPEALRAQVLPVVTTDHADYHPGGKASITGSGFQPGERVRLLILQSDLCENGRPEHQPWQVRADGIGSFHATWPVTAHEAGATLWLAAKGLASQRTAYTIFTDASIVPASGGSAIPADSFAGPYTALSGPVVTETLVGDINVGTIVLTAPAGFVFDTNTPLPVITLAGDNNNKNINNLHDGDSVTVGVTTNSLTFTVVTKSHGQTKNTLTYSNIRVRPTAASPLSSGNITNTGTSAFPNSTANFGTLTEVAGSSTHLVVSGFPSPQVAGTAGSVTVAAQDQFGNVTTDYVGTVHFTSSDAQATLPADYTFLSADGGTHTFSAGMTLRTLGTQSITASNMAPASFSGSQSGIVVNPAPANHLVFATQPGSTTYGSLLSPQPVLVSRDAFGNNSTVGVGASKMVTVTLTSGSGSLLGTASLDIGTGASNGTATFNNLAVNAAGAGKQLTASATGLTNVVSSSFTVTQATLTANVTVSNKVYDATTGATIATRSLSGVLGTDNVTLTGGTAAFATKSVGNGKSATVSGLGLGGIAAANYALASTTVATTANITPASLGVTAVLANNKVYDGTTGATLGGTPALSGLFSGDSVTLGGSPLASFANKAVGNNKPVTVSGNAVSGPDSGNYTLAQPTGLTAHITVAGLTVSGVTANDKVYDGTTSVTLNTGGAGLPGVFGGDSVTLNTASATGSFTTKTVGTGKTVNVSGLTLSGADSANYTLAQPTTTANITAAALSVSGVTAGNKVYDSSTAATLNTAGAALVGVQGSDSVTLNSAGAAGSFATKNVGTAKTVTVSGLTVSGADISNYNLAQPTTSANITLASLTVTATATDKVYDGTTTASAVLSDNRVGGDSLTVSYTAATFTDKHVGNGKTVNVTGIAITGPDAANYNANTTTTSVASITRAILAGAVAAQGRLYGQANPPFTINYSGFIPGDNIGILTGALSFSTTAVTNSPVGIYTTTAAGQSASDYTIQYVDGTLTVSPAHLCAAAGDAARLYGHQNPAFTASISGFVNVSTTAQTNSPPGNYPIVPSGLFSLNYSITYSNGTLAVTSTNQLPALDVIPDATVRPDESLIITITGSDPDGDHVAFSLDPGTPAGSAITNLVTRISHPGGNPTFVTNTVFLWTPTRAQASTTNLITVRLTDDGGPPMSTAQAFTVVVLDYVEIALGSTNVESGQSVAVPINLASSDGVTNLSFTVTLPNGYLANAALVATAPEIGSASLQDHGTNLVVSVQSVPGQVLQGSQQVALLTFEAISNLFSAFVPLPVSNAVAAKPDGTSYLNYLAPLARIAVIEGQPLLEASLSTNLTRELTLYGRLGHSYQLQSSTSLVSPIVWTPQWDYVQTNGVITIGVSSANPRIFYRIFEP